MSKKHYTQTDRISTLQAKLPVQDILTYSSSYNVGDFLPDDIPNFKTVGVGGSGAVNKSTLNKGDSRVTYNDNGDGTGGVIITFDTDLQNRFNYDESVMCSFQEYDVDNDCYLDRKTNPYRIVKANDGINILSVVFLDVLADIYNNGFKIILI